MKKLNFLSAFLLLCFALLSCDDDDPLKMREKSINKLYNEKNTVKIAVVNSYERNISAEWNGICLAKQVIENEGILGKNLEILKFDDHGDFAQGSNVAYSISDDHEISAVIGHGYSDISIPASIIYQYYGILMFNTSSTSPRLTMANNPILVRNIPDDNEFGKKVAELCAENKYSRVLIYYLNMAAANSLANSFEFNAIEKKISIVSRVSYELTTPEEDFRQVFSKWKNDFIFDAVLLAGTNPSIGKIVKQIRECGINCPIIGADSFEDDVFKKSLSEKESGRIFAASVFSKANDNESFVNFYNLYKEKYDLEPDYEALLAYDALMVIAKSISMANSAVPSKFVSYIKNNEWDVAAGPYTFESNGDVKDRKLYKKVFKDGDFVEIKKN